MLFNICLEQLVQKYENSCVKYHLHTHTYNIYNHTMYLSNTCLNGK